MAEASEINKEEHIESQMRKSYYIKWYSVISSITVLCHYHRGYCKPHLKEVGVVKLDKYYLVILPARVDCVYTEMSIALSATNGLHAAGPRCAVLVRPIWLDEIRPCICSHSKLHFTEAVLAAVSMWQVQQISRKKPLHPYITVQHVTSLADF